MTEYSRQAKGSFTSTGAAKFVNLPFQPDYIELINYTAAAAMTDDVVPFAWWDVAMGQGFAVIERSTGAALISDIITSNGFSTFSAGISLQYGPTQQIVGISKATPARVNVTAHGYSVGDTIIMQGLALATTNNMQLLNSVPFTIVTVSDADHFDVKWDTTGSNYTALSASPAGALVKKVLYPFLYVPEDNVVTAVTTGTTTTVTTSMYHNFEVGQEIAFRIPGSASNAAFWGPTQLNSLPDILIPGSPIYGYVVSITDNWTFVCNINSTGFTAFTNNSTMTSATLAGLSYPQVLSVGDVNTGGNLITSTSSLYPPPSFPTSTNRVPTINGPAIRGAFVNNTSQGFIVGNGAAVGDADAHLVGANADVIYWRAYLHDISLP